MKNKRLYALIKHVCYFALMYILSRAEIAGLFPFGYGVYLALVFSGANILIISPLYVLSAGLAGFNLGALLCAGSMAVVLITAKAIHLRLKRGIKIWQLLIYALIGQAGYIFIAITASYNLLNAVLTICLGLAFTLAAACVFSAIVRNKLKYKPDTAEIASALVMLAALSLGLCGIEPLGLSVHKAAGMLITLVATAAFGGGAGAAAGAAFGMGGAFYSNMPELAALYALAGLLASIFVRHNRAFAALSALSAEVLFGYYFLTFGSYSYNGILASAIGCAAFMVIPKRALEALSEAVFGRADNYAVRHIINHSREVTANRLKEVAKVFDEMRVAFSGLIKGNEEDAEVAKKIARDIPACLCAGCKNTDICAARGEEVIAAFNELVLTGIKKGRVTLMDVPQILVSRCGRTAEMLKLIGKTTEDYLRYKGCTERMDAAKSLVSQQLGGISEVLGSLSLETKRRVGFDVSAERRFIEELTIADVIAGEAVIASDGYSEIITLIVKTDTLKESAIITAAERIFKRRMRIAEITASNKAGFSVVTLARAPRFDLAIGVSGLNKNNRETGGDTHTFTKISNERLLLALCDGMGSGENAERVSSMAISLIENFYRAGFSTELILTSVNKLLALALDETFSALDIAVVDLNTARCDFIKFGAPPSVIKHKHECDIVCGGALPIGAVGDIEPIISTATLNPYDTVVLCTDGISDVFKEEAELAGYVNNTRILNPQDLAAEIVTFARDQDKQLPHDDMTCLAFRLLPV